MRSILLGAFVSLAASCTTRPPVRYSHYERMPENPTSVVFRAVQKSIPYTRQHAFWGNYGGSGNLGGKPIDEMDELFRRHDIVYVEAKSLPLLWEADRQLVRRLQGLNPTPLPPDGKAYRDKTILLFNSALAKTFGKPLPAVFRREEPEWGYFQNKETVQSFFDPANPAFPDRDRHSRPSPGRPARKTSFARR